MCKVISKELLKARERRTVCQWSYILCDCLQCLFNGKWLWLLENYDGGGFLLMWKQSSHLLWQSKSNTPVHIIVMITALPSRSLISRSGKIPVTLAHKNCRASKGNTDCSHCTDSQLAADGCLQLSMTSYPLVTTLGPSINSWPAPRHWHDGH